MLTGLKKWGTRLACFGAAAFLAISCAQAPTAVAPPASPSPTPQALVSSVTPAPGPTQAAISPSPHPTLLVTATSLAAVTAQPTVSHRVSPYSHQPLPTPAEGSLAIVGLSFADALHGWAVAGAYDPEAAIDWTAVLNTTDGGQHWDLIPAPNAVVNAVDGAPELPVANQISFTSR